LTGNLLKPVIEGNMKERSLFLLIVSFQHSK